MDNPEETDKSNVYKCPFCEQVSKSSPGKKGCIAKIHQVKGEKEQIVFKEAKVKNENGME